MQKTIKRRQPDLQSLPELIHYPPLLKRVFANRQVTSEAELDYRFANLLDPQQLKGIQAACSLLNQALKEQWSILVVGDFDADGATSSALAVSALKAMGAASVDFLVPNRFQFGYGLTPEIVEVAAQRSPQLIVTVDNGISSLDGVVRANELGIAVLVTDHHLPGAELPKAAAIVNPNQPGCTFASKNLAGVGVIFNVLVALRAQLRADGWFAKQGIAEPNLADYLDLVALGTVADVVPLDANNRLLIHQGLARIRAGKARPGIAAMIEIAGRDAKRLVAADLGFIVGPRLNAAGRLDDMSLGIRCLLSDDPFQARELAGELNDLNQDRRAIEASMQKEALASLADINLGEVESTPWGLCLYQPQWHQGVVGILASRIKERFHRPVIAFADSDAGNEIKGSARSIPGLHIRDALDRVASSHPGLISKFGGHAMAAGLSISKAKFPQFAKAFDQTVRELLSADDLSEAIWSDGELLGEEFNLPLAEAIRNAGPWGQAFPEPLFDGEFQLVQSRLVSGKHLKMVVAPVTGGQPLIDAIAFNVDTDQWPNAGVERVHMVYQLEVNEYRGQQSVQLLVRHLWPANVA
ncbi:single-stranded-DNA-specific exonuclease RecJ [Halioxenophilus sp. WMMB6]|uniref:single-stranded-DNA-specific exonuclease RecJ n=1 Tax=Halioxenophilus sp. WMMB6 TaxID=3073815 RepID=UPI00295EE796|nr:single-stranded-DNA-specific exonuclease RecJ [Halioxenophilus sp. WMMB6]